MVDLNRNGHERDRRGERRGKVEKRREGETNIYIHTYMNSCIEIDYSHSDLSIGGQ